MFDNKEYVYEVYKERSFSKAAENLYISQPSLSLTIKKVESRLGVQLFDRSTNPIGMTESGMEYIRCVERIIDIEDGFQSFLGELNELRTGTLTIGASNVFASYILPPYITRFLSRYPAVQVALVEANTSTLEKRLFAGDLDLIVDNSSMDELAYKKLSFYPEQLILAVPAKLPHNLSAKPYCLNTEDIVAGRHQTPSVPAVPLELFADAPFVLLRHGSDTRSRADAVFTEWNISPNVIMELDQLATAYHTVCYGLGVTFVSDTLVREMPTDPRIVYYRVDSKHMQRENYFYHKLNRYVTRAMQEFLKLTAST